MGAHNVTEKIKQFMAQSGLAATSLADFSAEGIKADVVAESTSAAGVTVDSMLIKDGGCTPATVNRTSQEYLFNTGGKVGTTAGWSVPGDNKAHYTCPQSQTASTLVIPISGLKVGWTITEFKVVGQIESAGGTVTLDADLRKLTTAAGDLVDASVGAITQISVTADTAVATTKTALTEVVAATESFYVLLTATTAATTDIDLQGVTVTVTEV